jgi:hypothetical protein
MSFNDIEPFRKALEGVPEGLIKPNMASLLWVIVSYPNGCYIGQDALAKQARLKHDNFTRVLRACTKLGLIDREQSYARKGIQQCYRVNMNRLNELVRVENSPPNTTNRVELKPVLGGNESVSGGTQVHPYKDNKYYKSSTEDLFSSTLSFIPANKRFAISEDIKKLLKELEHRGTTLEAIEAEFSRDRWESIHSPKVIVTGRLRDMVARPVQYSATDRPPKCANPDCDEETRTLPYPVPVPNGNGQETYTCLECNHFWVNKRNGF